MAESHRKIIPVPDEKIGVKKTNVSTVSGTGPFITTWKNDNPGTSGNNQITGPTGSMETYDYSVDWGDGSFDTNLTGNSTHTYARPGTYQVSISGNFPRIAFRRYIDNEKIIYIDQWGDIEWTSFAQAFTSCINLDMKATDVPNLTNTTSLFAMFSGCSSLIGNASFNNDGRNDRFEVMGIPCNNGGIIYVYDRYGKLLYQNDISGLSWDGTFNGNRLPANDYWYKFIDLDSNTPITGHFALKR